MYLMHTHYKFLHAYSQILALYNVTFQPTLHNE